ncbi:MAG TPA: hypothetical protein VEN81_14375 [Planctomycetota bacterium]|nr:hypothetical protein [Planctomycetota bacterium]
MNPVLAFLVLLPSPQAEPESVRHLIAELGSPSKERREVAAFALEAHGPAVALWLVQAKADPGLIDACRGITREMRALLDSLDRTRLSVSVENVKADDFFKLIHEKTGVWITLSDDGVSSNLSDLLTVTLKGEDLSLASILRTILKQLPPDHEIRPTRSGKILLASQPEPPPLRVPVRVLARRGLGRELIPALGNDSPEERDRASGEFRRLSFAAEPALWTALDSPLPEVRTRAVDLLRELYGQRTQTSRIPALEAVESPRFDIDLTDLPALQIVEEIARRAGLDLVVEPAAQKLLGEKTFYRITHVTGVMALRLFLGPRGMTFGILNDAVFVTIPSRLESWTGPGPFWMEARQASNVESQIEDLAGGDPDARRRAEDALVARGSEVFGPLRTAQHVLSGVEAVRIERVRREIARRTGAWLPDLPGAMRVESLSDSQRALLDRTVAGRAAGVTLEELLQTWNLRGSIRRGGEHRLTVSTRGMTVFKLLQVITGPSGLDFTLEGETIVIDSATEVRAAAERQR